MRILHLAERAHWHPIVEGRTEQPYRWSTRGLDLDQVGFLHACTPAQLAGVVERFYSDVDLADFLVLVVDVELCEAGGTPVRWDPVGDDHFPHLYGPLPTAAVVATVQPSGTAGRLDTAALQRSLTGLLDATG